MPLITLDNISLRFSEKIILDEVNATIHKGDKIGLIGRNGEGKSTFLKLLAGLISADDGDLKVQNRTTISYLEQQPPEDNSDTLFNIVAQGLGDAGKVIANYHDSLEEGNDSKSSKLQQQIESEDLWHYLHKIETILNRFQLNSDSRLSTLSGGWKRRVMLARAIIQEPDILLLDEPTNHMDITAILDLEKMLKDFHGTLLLISHDRSFVKGIVNKIFDLDRGRLSVFDCGYDDYLKRKEILLNSEELENARFNKKLAQEEVWIRQGVKARRTRNEGRVERLKEMRNQRSARRERQGNVSLSMNSAESSGKNVFELENVSFGFDLPFEKSTGNQRKEIVRNFTSVVMRGDRIGLVGPNGAGKSTVMKLLLEQIKPEAGTIKVGTKLDVAYFDQSRSLLDLEKSVAENVGDGKDEVEVDGRSRHILGSVSYTHLTLPTNREV